MKKATYETPTMSVVNLASMGHLLKASLKRYEPEPFDEEEEEENTNGED